jgi:hypothetical protein
MNDSNMLEHNPNDPDYGVVYYTDENPLFKKMLGASIASLRRFHPDWPVKVFTIPTPECSLVRKIYRKLTPWKNVKRYERCGQDSRVNARKIDILFQTPFKYTFFLDVDTIVMSPMNELSEWIKNYDAIIAPLSWKMYERTASWQPQRWPYIMSGVFTYNNKFSKLLHDLVIRFGGTKAIAKLHNTDQRVISLLCHSNENVLKIKYWPDFQIDTANLEQHLGTSNYPKIDGKIDIRSLMLRRFRIFHYNEFKPAYMEQIRKFWRYDL